MSKTLTIPWSDDLALGGRCDRVGPVQVIMGQAITIECRSSDDPPVSADGRPLEAWLALGRADGTALYHWTNSRFTNRAGGDFDLPLTADETALAPGTYYLEVRDATAGNEHVLARALLNLIASPSYASIVTPPPLAVDTAHGGTGANLSAAGPGFLRFAVLGGPTVVQALALTDLPSGGAGSGDVLAWNGTHWVPATVSGTGDMTKAVYDTNGDGVLNTGAIPASFATTAYVAAQIAALVNSAPGALDTLKELADALGDDANFVATMTTALALKAPIASPALTGTPTVPTAAPGTNTTQAASTAFVTAAVAAGGGGGGMAIGGTVTGGTATYLLYVGASGVLAQKSTLAFDGSTDTLTVGGAVVTPKHQFPSGYFLWEIFSGTFTWSGGLQRPSVAIVVGNGQGEVDIYNTYTDASNFERAFARWVSNVFTIGTASAGTGTARDVKIVQGSASLLISHGSGAILDYGGTNNFVAQNGSLKLVNNAGYLQYDGLLILPQVPNNVDLGRAANTFKSLFLGTSLIMLSVADQSAPAAGSGVAYFRTNGGGKMEFVVRFPTGAIQVIATEP